MAVRQRWAVVTLLGVLALGLLSTGCSSRVGQLALVSTRTPQYDRIANATMVRDVRGYDSRTWFLFIPFGDAKYGDAIDRALSAAQGDFMTNVQFRTYWWSLLLVSYYEVSVVGDVGNSRGGQTLIEPKK